MMKLKASKSIFAKIVIVFFVSILPLYILIGYVSYSNYQILRREVINSKNLAIKYYTSNVFDDLEQTQNQIYQFLNSSDMKLFSIIEGNNNYIKKLELSSRLQEQIVNISISNKYTENIYVWVENGAVISVNHISFDGENKGMDLVQQFFENNTNLLYDHETNKLYMVACNPSIALLGKDRPNAIAFVEISPDKIQAFITEYCTLNPADGHVALISSVNNTVLNLDGSINKNTISTLLDSKSKTSSPIQLHPTKVNNNSVWNATNESSLLGMKIIVYLDKFPIEYPIKNTVILYIIIAVITILIVKIDLSQIKKIVSTPILMLVNAFNKSDTNEYIEITEEHRKDEFGYIFSKFNNLVIELRKNISMVYEQKMRTQEAEFKHLQVQINPHFLYNSLFTISRLAKDGNTELTSKFAEHLSNYYCYITKTGKEFVSLKEELTHAQRYIDIMSMRFGNRVNVFINNQLTDSSMMVPKLILQPLIENAFEHGMKNILTDGEIHVTLSNYRTGLCITVEDNGEITDIGLTDRLNTIINQPNEPVNMTGLSNVNKRLKIRYGDESGLKFLVSSYGGLRVDLYIIPVQK